MSQGNDLVNSSDVEEGLVPYSTVPALMITLSNNPDGPSIKLPVHIIQFPTSGDELCFYAVCAENIALPDGRLIRRLRATAIGINALVRIIRFSLMKEGQQKPNGVDLGSCLLEW
ncbi:hypothetical protein HGA91_02360 [candidate division WWE3 bacterium]|nr:hypothetical protein [candidate division WWE3 bacterium]